MKQVRCLDGPARAAQIASRRILSVDDGSGIARRLGEAIGALTCRVRTAYSVPEGLQSGLLEPPDLLIVDLGSGGGGGSSLPGILRRLGTGKPFKVAGLTSLQGVQLSRLEGHLRPYGFDKCFSKLWPVGRQLEAAKVLLVDVDLADAPTVGARA